MSKRRGRFDNARRASKRLKTRLIVATEDTKSSNRYLRELVRSINRYHEAITISFIKTRSNETAPHQVVQRAIDEGVTDLDEELGDSMWVVVDADVLTNSTNRANFETRLQMATQRGIRVAIANPCFEHWLRLHITDAVVDGAFQTADELITSLNAELDQCDHCRPDYDKAKFPFETLIANYDCRRAAERARQQHSQKSGGQMNSPHLCQPCVTNIYLLIEWMEQIVAARDPEAR